MRTYNNLVEATNDLMKRGYTENLSLEGDTVDDKGKKIQMAADDFDIDEFYRFEGASNPDDNSIIYAVSSEKYNIKGVLINAFGAYANTSESAIEAKLHHYQVSDNLKREDKPTE
ncbi:phosphoribosylpyrophosphate synthetase [Mucilaginibacter sp.]|uniref:phosphoribosylpyrophosphate synthetase n=1 Tax=Mucilaginibacter sp. TaxID=1882438 RepID=UPI003D0C682F